MQYTRFFCYLSLGFLYLTLTSGACVDVVSFSAPNVLDQGKPFQTTVAVKNKSADGTYSFPVYTHLSLDSVYNPEDVLLGESYVTNLPGLQVTNPTMDCRIPAGTTGGAWYLIAKADQNRAGMFDLEDYKSRKVTVNGPSVAGTDLTISNIQLKGQSFQPGQQVSGRFLLHNQGPVACGAFKMRCQLVTDAKTYTLQQFSVPAVTGYSNSEYLLTFKIPGDVAPGGYRFSIVADYLSEVVESNKLNNSLSVQPFVVQAGLYAHQSDERTGQPDADHIAGAPVLSLAPNPSRGITRVTGSGQANTTGVLCISDMQGQALWELSVTFNDEGQLVEIIDLEDFPVGAYIVSLRAVGQKTHSKRLIIQQ